MIQIIHATNPEEWMAVSRALSGNELEQAEVGLARALADVRTLKARAEAAQ